MIWRGSNDYPGDERADPSAGAPDAGPGAPDADAGPVGSRIESVLEAAERAAAGIRQDAEEWARRYLDDSRRKADEIAAQRVRELSDLTDSLMSRARAVAQQSDELIAALDDAGRRLVNSARPGGQQAAPQDQYGGAVGPQSGGVAPPPQVPVPPQAPAPQAPPSPPPAAAPPAQEPMAPPPQPPPPAQAAPEAAPPPAIQPQQPGPPPMPPPAAQPAPAQPAPPPPAAAPPQPVPAQQPRPGPPGYAPAGGDARVSEGARLLATQMAVAGSTRDEIAWRLREEFGIQDATAILDEIGL